MHRPGRRAREACFARRSGRARRPGRPGCSGDAFETLFAFGPGRSRGAGRPRLPGRPGRAPVAVVLPTTPAVTVRQGPSGHGEERDEGDQAPEDAGAGRTPFIGPPAVRAGGWLVLAG
jgi:hypothetical protein